MRTLTIDDEEHIRRFIEQLNLHNPQTPVKYQRALRGFLRVARVRSERLIVSEKTLHSWLHKRRRQIVPRRIERDAFLIDRFLDWLQRCGTIPSNPLRDLRERHDQHLTPIVRALLRPDSQAALKQLRPLKRFVSFLGPQMRDHVALMRSLGRRYLTAERTLRRFDRFVHGRPELTHQPLPTLLAAWGQTATSAWRALDAQWCGRVLSKAQHRQDSSVAIIPSQRQLSRQVRATQRRAYIYTEQEIINLLAVARSYPSPMAPLRPLTLYTMLVLAYCVGLRLGEIVKLTLGDVDLQESVLTIRETKFFKSRRTPVTPSVMTALRAYLDERQKVGAPTETTAALFWHSQASRCYTSHAAGVLLMKVLRLSGIKPARGKRGPRVHDLRHSMVSNRMLSWYQEGINPQSRLAHLATFLGHKDINSTLTYITVAPELLQLASGRFRQHAAHVLNAENLP